MKVIIGLVNRNLRLLDGKCINNRTRGRSGKGAELIVYCFRKRHLWGSKLHAGYSIPLRFYLGALFGDDVKKFVSDLIIYSILYDRRGGFLGGALEWFQRSYIIVMPCLCFIPLYVLQLTLPIDAQRLALPEQTGMETCSDKHLRDIVGIFKTDPCAKAMLSQNDKFLIKC